MKRETNRLVFFSLFLSLSDIWSKLFYSEINENSLFHCHRRRRFRALVFVFSIDCVEGTYCFDHGSCCLLLYQDKKTILLLCFAKWILNIFFAVYIREGENGQFAEMFMCLCVRSKLERNRKLCKWQLENNKIATSGVTLVLVWVVVIIVLVNLII